LVAAHQGAIQQAMLALIEIKSGFVHGGTIVDDQHVTNPPLVNERELWADRSA
jgi:hypothetical protein